MMHRCIVGIQIDVSVERMYRFHVSDEMVWKLWRFHPANRHLKLASKTDFREAVGRWLL